MELDRHAGVLRRLVAEVEGDERWRWLELACSVARGAGDAESDLDVGVGAAEDVWPSILEDVPGMVARLGEVVDSLHHQMEGWGERPHRRSFVQYADGVQLDLVAVPESFRAGLPPGSVALYDPDGRLARPWQPLSLRADAVAVREWAFLGWAALGDLAKYLGRGSPWEAHSRLEEARAQAWRLWAVTLDAHHPLFGLVSVLDLDGAELPEGIDATVAGLDASELLRAAFACADLLDDAGAKAAARVGAELPAAMAAFTRGRLGRLGAR